MGEACKFQPRPVSSFPLILWRSLLVSLFVPDKVEVSVRIMGTTVITLDDVRALELKEEQEESILAMLGIIGTFLNLFVIVFVYIYTTLWSCQRKGFSQSSSNQTGGKLRNRGQRTSLDGDRQVLPWMPSPHREVGGWTEWLRMMMIMMMKKKKPYCQITAMSQGDNKWLGDAVDVKKTPCWTDKPITMDREGIRTLCWSTSTFSRWTNWKNWCFSFSLYLTWNVLDLVIVWRASTCHREKQNQWQLGTATEMATGCPPGAKTATEVLCGGNNEAALYRQMNSSHDCSLSLCSTNRYDTSPRCWGWHSRNHLNMEVFL